MRNFLRRLGKTKNPMIRHMSDDREQAIKEATVIFQQIKRAIADGIPVLIHQYWKGPGTRGHYRVITGYNDRRQMITLNDPSTGKSIRQRYDEFYRQSDVDEEWLHFNCIIFNYDKAMLEVTSLIPAATAP